MRKVLFFVLLLVVFLLALVTEWNLQEESRTARSNTTPPEIRDDDVLEVTIGYPEGLFRSSAPSRNLAPRDGRSRPAGPVDHRENAGAAADGTPPERHPKPVPTPRPAVPQRHIYIVENGDNLTSIAKKILGDESHAKQLKEWNRLRNPDLIVPGQELIYYK